MAKISWKVYARREPTTDHLGDVDFAALGKRDVVIYRDRKCTELRARYPWYRKSRPTPRRKTIILNCALHDLVWLRDKTR
jgi:hypothetical protein